MLLLNIPPREVMHSFNKAVDHAANGGPSGAVPKPASLARDLRRLKQTTVINCFKLNN